LRLFASRPRALARPPGVQMKRDRGKSRWRRLLVLAAAGAAAALFATAAAAVTSWDCYYGPLTSGEYRSDVDHGFCVAMVGSGAAWNTGGGAAGKVVLIRADGSWLAARESQSGAEIVELPASYDAHRAYCRNSTPWQITVNFLCRAYEDWHSGCA
jgi:hypothetical protein